MGDSAAERARLLIGSRRYQDALDVIGRALATTPDDAELHCLAAQAYLDMGAPWQADGAALRAIGLAPDREWGHRLLSIARRQRGDRATADAAAATARRIAPMNPAVLRVHMQAQLGVGKHAEAWETLTALTAIDPASAETVDSTRAFYRGVRQRDDEERYAREALAMHPDNPDFINNLGAALLAQGRRQEALRCFVSALQVDPQNQTAIANLKAMAQRDHLPMLEGRLPVFIHLLGLPVSAVLGIYRRFAWYRHIPPQARIRYFSWWWVLFSVLILIGAGVAIVLVAIQPANTFSSG